MHYCSESAARGLWPPGYATACTVLEELPTIPTIYKTCYPQHCKHERRKDFSRGDRSKFFQRLPKVLFSRRANSGEISIYQLKTKKKHFLPNSQDEFIEI